jgi:hypothetical protein
MIIRTPTILLHLTAPKIIKICSLYPRNKESATVWRLMASAQKYSQLTTEN